MSSQSFKLLNWSDMKSVGAADNLISRCWTFTLNNYTEKDVQMFKDFEKKYLSMGREIGESGTPHLQGCIIWLRNYTFKSLKKLVPKAHWEKAREIDCMNYTFKDQDYYLEDNRRQGQRTDLLGVADRLNTGGLQSVIDENPREYIKYHSGIEKLAFRKQKDRDFKPEVFWLYGKTGTGKTRYVFENEKDIWFSGRDLKWWDGYENQEAVIFDDFRRDFCTFHELLRILDRYPYNVNVKGGFRKFNSKRIYITTCFHPQELYDTREDIQQLIRRIDVIKYFE